MVVPNLVFDLLVYGALLIGLLVDLAVPSLRGAATLVAVCAATYVAAEDSCIVLSRRRIWTQESLATALSLSVVAFIYYWWRNDCDLMAVVLHVGLMMASLMILIALVAALSVTLERKSPVAVVGLLATTIIALLLGVLAGALVFFLTSATVSLPIKIALLIAGTVIWKIREGIRPPAQNEEPPAGAEPKRAEKENLEVSRPAGARHEGARHEGLRPEGSRLEGARSGEPKVAHPGSKRVFVPQRGSLLDRFVPILVLCIVAFLALGNAVGIAIK